MEYRIFDAKYVLLEVTVRAQAHKDCIKDDNDQSTITIRAHCCIDNVSLAYCNGPSHIANITSFGFLISSLIRNIKCSQGMEWDF
jgi:hypothetical protein